MSEESYKILYFTAGQTVYYPEISYQHKNPPEYIDPQSVQLTTIKILTIYQYMNTTAQRTPSSPSFPFPKSVNRPTALNQPQLANLNHPKFQERNTYSEDGYTQGSI